MHAPCDTEWLLVISHLTRLQQLKAEGKCVGLPNMRRLPQTGGCPAPAEGRLPGLCPSWAHNALRQQLLRHAEAGDLGVVAAVGSRLVCTEVPSPADSIQRVAVRVLQSNTMVNLMDSLCHSFWFDCTCCKGDEVTGKVRRYLC